MTFSRNALDPDRVWRLNFRFEKIRHAIRNERVPTDFRMNYHETQNRLRVVSLLANVVAREEILTEIEVLARGENGGYVCVANVHMVMEAYDNAEFAAQVNAADLVITDGMPLVWMQKLQGAKTAHQFRGNDLMIALLERAAREDLKVGFYGGQPEVIDSIVKKANAEFPALQISYSFSPPFRQLTGEEDAAIISQINGAGTQILFVGLGCPKQEKWMAAHKNKIRAVTVGVGAAFDFYAGNINQSPGWMSKYGLEWLYRLTREPKRLWRRYLILNPRFMFLAAKQLGERSSKFKV